MGRSLKRIVDVFVSSLALLFLWPLMLVIGIVIRLESHGPAIYRSLRLGKFGREFDCFKFRTMIAGSDGLKENLRRLNQRRGPFFKIADDPRVTRLGRFLRKYSLDELPQLWNVLKGDMSLVGPRPAPGRGLCSLQFRRLPAPQRETRYHRALAGHGPLKSFL